MEVANTVPDFLRAQWDRHAELIELSRACQELSDRFSIELPEGLDRAQCLGALERPFRLAVIGDSEVGKSTLLSEVAGLPILKGFSRGGWVRHQRAKSDGFSKFEDRLLDAPVLKALECFESPKLSVDAGSWEQSVLEDSDLVLLLFSAKNPWSAATWNWFERHFDANSTKIVVLLTHADCFDVAELRTIEKHMREIAIQRCGAAYPLSIVGGEGSFQQLYRELEARLASLPGLRERTKGALAMIDAHQAEIEKVLERRARILRKDGGFLEELEKEIAKLQSAELREIENKVKEGFGSFLDAGAKVLVFLRGELGVLKRWRALLLGDRLAPNFERQFQLLAGEKMEQWAMAGFDRHLRRLRSHWNEVTPRSKRQLRLDLTPFPEEELRLIEERRKDVILDAVRKRLLRARMRDVLLAELHPHRQMILSWFTLALFFWISAALIGVSDLQSAAIVFLGLAGFSFLVSAFRVWAAGKEIRSHMSKRIKSLGPDISACLEPVSRSEVLALFAKYRSCFGQVNEHINRSRGELLPAQKRWRAVYLRLKTMQQDQ